MSKLPAKKSKSGTVNKYQIWGTVVSLSTDKKKKKTTWLAITALLETKIVSV